MTTDNQTPGYIVLIETDGTLSWLCQLPTFEDAARAMDEWLVQHGRSSEDTAVIVPTLAFGRGTGEG